MTDPTIDRHMKGFGEFVGYRVARWEPDLCAVAVAIEPRHVNIHDIVHGGVVTTIMDKAGGLCGLRREGEDGDGGRTSLTISMTVNFLASAGPGAVLTATARKRGGGKRIFFCSIEVTDEDGRLIALGDGAYKLREAKD
ncbi:MAG: PaaI family thioesterase [Rhodospirillaceae bacterium]|nr:PaaI family thioesterase [Rhodospirillaceae bacterium]